MVNVDLVFVVVACAREVVAVVLVEAVALVVVVMTTSAFQCVFKDAVLMLY